MAAKSCNDFVMIHPFANGNGRMRRLISNAILLKYEKQGNKTCASDF
ncbi:hypothetical protein ABHI18_011411 [Aspergillus niger]